MSEAWLSEREHADLMRLRSVLVDVHAMGLPPLVCLLTIAVEPGLSINDLAERTGVPQQSVSRHVAALLGRYQTDLLANFDPLVEQHINAEDPRKRALHLTPAGREIVARLLASRDYKEREISHVGG
jgi:DNA-binding MarR family transcriptional regulator